MAKVSSIKRNDKRKKLVKSYSKVRLDLKNKIYDKTKPLDERFSLVMLLAKLPRNSARNRIRNRCELTGRPRGTFRKFKLSRNMIREFAGKGMLPGLIKASW